MLRRQRQNLINNENENPSQIYECKFKESLQKLCQERKPQQFLEQISSQLLLSNTFDIYAAWNGKEEKTYKNYHKPVQSQKSTIESSVRVRSQVRTATPNQRRSKRTQSHLKETKILLDICPKYVFQLSFAYIQNQIFFLKRIDQKIIKVYKKEMVNHMIGKIKM